MEELYKKALKVQISSEVALIQVVRNGLVFKIARKKIHQNFLASKYGIKSECTEKSSKIGKSWPQLKT